MSQWSNLITFLFVCLSLFRLFCFFFVYFLISSLGELFAPLAPSLPFSDLFHLFFLLLGFLSQSYDAIKMSSVFIGAKVFSLSRWRMKKRENEIGKEDVPNDVTFIINGSIFFFLFIWFEPN